MYKSSFWLKGLAVCMLLQSAWDFFLISSGDFSLKTICIHVTLLQLITATLVVHIIMLKDEK